jgi:hypothetical protein
MHDESSSQAHYYFLHTTAMSFSFKRPVGAIADTTELEYVSALHQTNVEGIRKDGSIQGENVRRASTQ